MGSEPMSGGWRVPSGGLPKTNKKLAVWERDQWRCRYCGVPVYRAPWQVPDGSPNMATVDHLLPRVLGGRNDFDNLLTACFLCNQEKGDGERQDLVGGYPIVSPTLGDVWPKP
jgi:5-methylcytosine-specific restriction endonuclease McrA